MTDKNEEIIKTLECCKYCCCKQCDEEPDFQEAINLINRQKAEIERIQKARLKQAQFLAEQKAQKYELINKLSRAKAEAYKEFAERLKEKKLQSTMDRRICTFEMIDNLLKEMVGEDA